MTQCVNLPKNTTTIVTVKVTSRTNVPIAGATVNMTVIDATTAELLGGVSWPQAGQELAEEPGTYEVTIPPEASVVPGQTYIGQVTSVSPEGQVYGEIQMRGLVL